MCQLVNISCYFYLWALNTFSLLPPWTRRPWPSNITLKTNTKTIRPKFMDNRVDAYYSPLHMEYYYLCFNQSYN